jgi:hypothetical protein
MKRTVTFAAVISAILLFSVTASAAEYWASKQSNKYHYPTCIWAMRILPENLIKFPSPEAAIRAGYIPCKVCRPPVSLHADIDTPHNRQHAPRYVAGDENGRRVECCRYHRGVCDCRYGRAVCCDGTFSKACPCR